MEREQKRLAYTLCFIMNNDKVLMLHRAKSPNQHKWNGLGGKLNESETPSEANVREVYEESEIDLNQAKKVNLKGIVTWEVYEDNKDSYEGGLYAFISYFDDDTVLFDIRPTEEGTLEWKNLSWVLDTNNNEVVDNIPLFLKEMLNTESLAQHHFVYKNGEIVNYEILPLPEGITKS